MSKNENTSQDNIIQSLNDYMLNANFINKFTLINKNEKKNDYKNNTNNNTNTNKKNIKTIIPKISTICQDRFSPEEQDKLFWCFYIFLYGFAEYQLAKTSIFKIEKDIKLSSATKLINVKNIIKENKLKMSELQDELTQQDIISVKGLYALCIIHNINILYIKNRTYYDIKVCDKQINVIINTNNEIYIPDNINEIKITEYKNSYWKIENISKPLKSISSYSLVELQNICASFNIPIKTLNKNILNAFLYSSLFEVLSILDDSIALNNSRNNPEPFGIPILLASFLVIIINP